MHKKTLYLAMLVLTALILLFEILVAYQANQLLSMSTNLKNQVWYYETPYFIFFAISMILAYKKSAWSVLTSIIIMLT